jgi:hypothetical protein
VLQSSRVLNDLEHHGLKYGFALLGSPQISGKTQIRAQGESFGQKDIRRVRQGGKAA